MSYASFLNTQACVSYRKLKFWYGLLVPISLDFLFVWKSSIYGMNLWVWILCVTLFACSSILWAFCLNFFHFVKCRWSSCLVYKFKCLCLGQWSGPWMLYTLWCILWCRFVTFSFVYLVDSLGSVVFPSQVFSESSSCWLK